MARLTTVAGMIGELTSRFANLEDGHAARTIYEVWRDICSETEAWRIVITTNVVQGDQQFTLVVPTTIGADIARVTNVTLNGGIMADGQYAFTVPSTLTLAYEAGETTTGGLLTTVVLQPWLNDPKGVPADQFALWHAAVYEGCCAKLSAMVSKPAWFDPQLARDAGWRYQRQVAKISMDVETGGTNQPVFIRSTSPFCDM